MPRHQQVITCSKSGGPVSGSCTCEGCNLVMCTVCRAYEGGLTTDCPGQEVSFDKQQEVHQTPLDYTEERGWHQGRRVDQRFPNFEATRRPPMPPRIDPRKIVAPKIDWTKIDRNAALQHELTLRAIDWVLADRACDDLSAALAHTASDEAQINFQASYRHVEESDDEFRQAARKLVAALEIDTHPTDDNISAGEL